MTMKLLPLYFAVPGLIYLGLILAIFIDSIIKVGKFWKIKKIKNNDLIIGFITSFVLFGILYLIYKGETKSLSLILVGPFLLIFLPYLIHIASHRKKTENYIYKLSAIIIVFSMVLIILRAIIAKLL